MRPLEITSSFLLAFWLIWPLGLVLSGRGVRVPSAPWIADVIAAAALLSLLLHLVFEGGRWQMIPLYGLAFVAAGIALARWLGLAQPVLPAWGSIVGLVSLALATALAALLPVIRLPEPTGPYSVGTVDMMLVDSSRQEIWGENPGGPRRLMLQVWYPAEPAAGARPSPWMADIDQVGPALAARFKLPAFLLSHQKLARSHSFAGAPFSDAQTEYPLLIFSHGWSGYRSQNMYQVEELASHGYVVAAVQHPYGATETVFPDGETAPLDPATLPRYLPDPEYRSVISLLVDQWANDLAFALDTLEGLDHTDSSGRFTGRLDLGRIGLIGHSMGGGAAVEFCGRDARCKAVLGLDAYLPPVSDSILDRGLEQPALFLYSELWPYPATMVFYDRLESNHRGPHTRVDIPGSGHYDFTDLPLFTPLAYQLGLKGPIPGYQMFRLVNDYSLGFFNQFLKGLEE